MLTFLNCHPGAPSLPRHLFKEACQKSPSKKFLLNSMTPMKVKIKSSYDLLPKGKREPRGRGTGMTRAPRE